MESGRKRLLRATRELLYERGFEATSPRDIQKRGEVGQGSFYHHFPSKRDLARAALEESRDEMLTELEQIVDSGESPLESLGAYLKAPRDALVGCRLGRLAMENSVIATEELREPLADYFAVLRRRLRNLVEEAVAAGELPRSLDPDGFSAMLAAIVQGGYVLARVSGDSNELDRALDGALALLDGGLRKAARDFPDRM